MSKQTKQLTKERVFEVLTVKPKHWTRLLASNHGLKWTNIKKDTKELVYGFDDGYLVASCDPITGLQDKLDIGNVGTLRIVGSNAFRKSISGYIKRYGIFESNTSIKRNGRVK